MSKETNVKEKMRIALILALNAGFMDGFSFFHFENRFIGAQSGNLIQAGLELAKGNIHNFFNFVIPIFFFILGVMTRGIYSNHLMKKRRFDAMYLLVLQWLGVTLFAVAYGAGFGLPVAVYVGVFSYFMAIQYDTFTKAHGLVYGSIFMTGNIRSMSVNLAQWWLTREPSKLRAVGVYLSLVFVFFAGAFLAVPIGRFLGDWTLVGSTLMLGLVILLVRFDHV